jgi:hypothetical protein
MRFDRSPLLLRWKMKLIGTRKRQASPRLQPRYQHHPRGSWHGAHQHHSHSRRVHHRLIFCLLPASVSVHRSLPRIAFFFAANPMALHIYGTSTSIQDRVLIREVPSIPFIPTLSTSTLQSCLVNGGSRFRIASHNRDVSPGVSCC